ncbi:MAG: toll/interleukin-1 receptor domain-containing protein [Clostridia bacterium]|nr:toll/interleukin-1 receptor domain-containing protein [Clostridia bacterium]
MSVLLCFGRSFSGLAWIDGSLFITKAIKECSCFVLLLSNDSQESEAVDSEVELATLTFKKSVITVELEKVVLNDSFTFYIHNKQIIAVHEIDENSHEIKQVLDAVRAYTTNNHVTNSSEKEEPSEKEGPPKNHTDSKISPCAPSNSITVPNVEVKNEYISKKEISNTVAYTSNSSALTTSPSKKETSPHRKYTQLPPSNLTSQAEEKPYLFVSFSTREKERIDPLLTALRQQGYRIWYRISRGGTHYTSRFKEESRKIENCTAIILFVSESHHNDFPFYDAIMHKKLIYPICLDKTSISDSDLYFWLCRENLLFEELHYKGRNIKKLIKSLTKVLPEETRDIDY